MGQHIMNRSVLKSHFDPRDHYTTFVLSAIDIQFLTATAVNSIQILTGCEVNIIRLLTRGLTVAQGRAAAAGNIEPEVNQRIMLTEMTVQICFVA